MARKKSKKRAKKKVKKKVEPKPAPAFDYFAPEPEREPVEDMVRRCTELVSRRKLKELADRPLPSSMTSAEIEEELKELLGDG